MIIGYLDPSGKGKCAVLFKLWAGRGGRDFDDGGFATNGSCKSYTLFACTLAWFEYS